MLAWRDGQKLSNPKSKRREASASRLEI